MAIVNWLLMYAALYVFIILHELGHFPGEIKFKFGILPYAAAMRSYYRLGGLVVNVIIFWSVFYFKPELFFLQALGLIAWLHYLVYVTLGSILPEPRESQVNIKTFIWDDVDNDYSVFFWASVLIFFIGLKDFYIPIIQGLF